MKNPVVIDIENLPKGVMLLTIKDVARALQMSDRFVQELIYTGKLRIVKIGRATRILPVDLSNYIKERVY